MKILLFSHKSDIDGMGNVILAKLAFLKVDYVLCETFNLQDEMIKYFNDNSIHNYDKIYITDMWLEEPLLTRVAEDLKLKDKVFIFDHHESALNNNCNKYPFITLKIKDNKGLCSGTSLFYEYLISNEFLSPNNKQVAEFVELTREYDTWEWATIYHNDKPRKLTLLFDAVGSHNYINLMFEKLKIDNKKFTFDKIEEMLIENRITKTTEKIKGYIQKIYYLEIFNLKSGLIFIDYEYRNDLAEYLRSYNYDIDFVMLVALDYGTISYRSIKENVNVRLIAEALGGKGHDKAASSPISTKTKQEIIALLTKMSK